MERCPELLDLEVFFGSAAIYSYGNEGGWHYDRLKFLHVATAAETSCVLEPAEGTFSVAHRCAGVEVLNVSLQHVAVLDIESSAGAQVLIGRVATPGLVQLFKLHLSPEFYFSLVTQLPSYK